MLGKSLPAKEIKVFVKGKLNFLFQPIFVYVHGKKLTFLLICPLRGGGLKVLADMSAKN